MLGKLIIALIVMMILLLVVYLCYGNELVQSIGEVKRSGGQKWKELKGKKPIAVVNGPRISIRRGAEKKYQTYVVENNVFTIGSAENSDLVLDSKTIEKRHAVIYKRIRHEDVFYELINYSKINPVEYYNKITDKYEFLGYKDGVELEAHEVFYIGDVKMVVVLPQIVHVPTDTERLPV